MDPVKRHEIESLLYSIVGASPQKASADLPTGVFLSVIASRQVEAGPSTKLPEDVKDLTKMYQTQSRHMYDMLTKVEYEHRHILPERFKEDGNQEDQYYSLKSRMAEIYRSKPIVKLLTIPLHPHIEFEQLQALEKAFYTHLEKSKGNVSVTGKEEKLNHKILQVVKIAADTYRTSASGREVSFEVRNFTLMPEDELIINQINGFGL